MLLPDREGAMHGAAKFYCEFGYKFVVFPGGFDPEKGLDGLDLSAITLADEVELVCTGSGWTTKTGGEVPLCQKG